MWRKLKNMWVTSLILVIFVKIFRFTSAVTTWSTGWYLDGSSWMKCDDSWKTCTQGNKWATCEDYMYLDLTTQLCELWSDGEYYDFTYGLWRSCGGIWTGYCSYQLSWFDWPSGQFFDTDLFMWVDNWLSPKTLISD